MMYKMYVRPHLEYGDIIYHGQSTELTKNLEQIQYKAALIVTGCWKNTSREKLYKELGWESLENRREYRRYCLFYKIKTNADPIYLSDHIPPPRPPSRVNTNRYKTSFFPFCYYGWPNLEENIRNANSLSDFKTKYLHLIRPSAKGICPPVDNFGLKRLTQLRVEHSDLRSHRFNKKFNCTSPTCRCGMEEETNEHYFLRCPLFRNQRTHLLSSLSDIIQNNISVLPDSHLCDLILYGSKVYNEISNTLIIKTAIN